MNNFKTVFNMENLRTHYDELKKTYGDMLVTPEMINERREKTTDEGTAEMTESKEQHKFPNLDTIDINNVMVGDVKLKDLMIAAVNAIITDNEDELYQGDGKIKVLVGDILEYAGFNIAGLIRNAKTQEEADMYLATSWVEDNDGNYYERTFIDKLLDEVFTEFGNRGWEVHMSGYDALSEDEVKKISRLLCTEDRISEEEMLGDDDSISIWITTNIVNQMLASGAEVTFAFEKSDEPCQVHEDDEQEEDIDEDGDDEERVTERVDEGDENPKGANCDCNEHPDRLTCKRRNPEGTTDNSDNSCKDNSYKSNCSCTMSLHEFFDKFTDFLSKNILSDEDKS